MASLLAFSALLSLASTALLAYAGALVLRRPASSDARLAHRMFATWWFSVAAVMLLAGAPTLLFLLGVTSVPLHVAITYALAVPLTVALWALLYYLVYIYTGRRSAIWPLGGAYLVFFAFTLYYFSTFGQRRLETTGWTVLVVGDAVPPAWVSLTFATLLAVPILLVAIGYASLFFRTPHGPHRYRIALVSGAFLLWFGAVLLGFLLGWDREDWFPLVYQTPGVAAALMVVAAFRPPRWVRERIRAEA